MELNPFSYSFHEDPYSIYAWLRNNAPVYRNEALDFYALSRYADVLAAHIDHETYSSAKGTVLEMNPQMVEAMPIILFMDPPRQTRLRKLVSAAFTPRRIAALEPTVRALAVHFLDRLEGERTCDFVREFAALMPIEMISTMLGVPAEDRNHLRELTDEALTRHPDKPEFPPEALQANAQVIQYFAGLVAERRRQPRDDMTSALVQAEVEDDDGTRQRLTDVEIIAFCGLLSGAGNETVTKLLGNAVVLLARHPAERDKILADPERTADAVEEVLRYWPPAQYSMRTLTRDVELHGETIPREARVLLLTGSACRDEREFERADAFDIDRRIPTQLAFGYGIHRCLGGSLARLESRVALEELHRRFPAYQIDEDGLERVHMSNVHGFAGVPMRLGKRL